MPPRDGVHRLESNFYGTHEEDTAVAVNLDLTETLLPHDESTEDAFERALAAWRVARARLETVDPSQLCETTREEYYRVLTRIGLWADARMGRTGDEPSETDTIDVEVEQGD